MEECQFQARMWRYEGKAAWHFISVPAEISQRLKFMAGGVARGFRSLPVIAAIGDSRWKTSIFPDSKRGVYLLPVKAEVRRQQGIAADDLVTVTLHLQI